MIWGKLEKLETTPSEARAAPCRPPGVRADTFRMGLKTLTDLRLFASGLALQSKNAHRGLGKEGSLNSLLLFRNQDALYIPEGRVRRIPFRGQLCTQKLPSAVPSNRGPWSPVGTCKIPGLPETVKHHLCTSRKYFGGWGTHFKRYWGKT